MLKLLKYAALGGGGLLLLIILTLGVLMLLSKPPKPRAERLAALPAPERATLDAVLAAIGMQLTDLRDIFGEAGPDDERNFRAIAIEEGHVRVLSLQKIGPHTLPSLSAWRGLEHLSLRGNSLATLPDLSGCTALQTLDLSQNNLSTLDPALLPSSLREIDLSENPLADLTPLARLTAAQKITLRHAQVTDLTPLLDLPLTLLDLRENPIATLPARFPKSPDFRVWLDGCPVFEPPGYVLHFSFQTKEIGVVGGRETREGMATNGKFTARGTWDVVPQAATISIPTSDAASRTSISPVDAEVSVQKGHLRIYLEEEDESRGPWFQRGFVKGAGGFIHSLATRYADATPGHPALLRGRLNQVTPDSAFFYIEPQPGEPVEGMVYRVEAK